MRQLMLTAPKTLEFQSIKDQPLKTGEIKAEAVYSAISHGTELNLFTGNSPFDKKEFNPEHRVFLPGANACLYPCQLGYEWVGVVTNVGPDTKDFEPGSRVHLPMPHADAHIFSVDKLRPFGAHMPLPPTLSDKSALFLNSTGIALQAIHDSNIQLGETVLISGLGTLGLIAVQLAKLSGARHIIVSDPQKDRRELAQRLGADDAIDPLHDDVGAEMKLKHDGADVAIEFSGISIALHHCIRSAKMGGRVVAAGFYQGGANDLRLGEEWLHNRISMVASMQGWGNLHRNAPLWDRARLRRAAIELLANGALQVEPLISHAYSFSKIADAYAHIEQGQPLKIIIEY